MVQSVVQFSKANLVVWTVEDEHWSSHSVQLTLKTHWITIMKQAITDLIIYFMVVVLSINIDDTIKISII